MNSKNTDKRLRRVLKRPNLRLYLAIGIVAFGLIGTISSIGSNKTDLSSSLSLIITFGLIGAIFLVGYISDKKFLRSVSSLDVQRVSNALYEEVQLEKRRTQAHTASKSALKSSISHGDEVLGSLVLEETFGFGTTKIYSNGFIYVTTRMSSPEKLISISGSTNLMIARGDKTGPQLGGAMLTIVTDTNVYTIKNTTDSNSQIHTPSRIAHLERIVAVGNSVISK